MNSVAKVNREHQTMTAVLMTVFWVGPMIWFLFILWREPDPLLAAAAVLAMPGGLLATRFPDAWFRPRGWERDGRVYAWIGIRHFNRLVVDGDWMNRRIRRALPEYRRYATVAGLRQLEHGTRPIEVVHWTLFLASVPPLTFALLAGEFAYAAFFGLGNVVVNLYPIGLQRALRARAATLGRRRKP